MKSIPTLRDTVAAMKDVQARRARKKRNEKLRVIIGDACGCTFVFAILLLIAGNLAGIMGTTLGTFWPF